jgi:probable HAF family extracellular repeat protein
MRTSLFRVTVAVLLLVGIGGLSTPARGVAAAPTYQVEDLGTLAGDSASVAIGINQSGDVVGWSVGPTGTRAFLYTDEDGMTALPAPPGRPVTHARAVNGNGTVVGTASTGGSDIGHAVRWQSGTALDLGTLGTGTFSEGRAVNTAGVAVGHSYTNGGSLLGIHAFRHDDAAGLVDLTPTADDAHAEGINDAGQVAGWSEGRAFRLTGTTFTDLGVPVGFAGSFGSAINDSGQVAGHLINATGSSERIFRYTDGVGMVILGGNGAFNRASGINSAGDVVGQGRPVLGLSQGFLFTDADGLQGLNSLIDPTAGWFILGAGGINDAGQIAGWASGPEGQRAVRLTPGGTTPATFTLSVVKSGTGSGTVTSSPVGIACGSDCSEAYGSGTSVTLTAKPGRGSSFAGWSGACTGTGSCVVSMTEARSVTATFTGATGLQ